MNVDETRLYVQGRGIGEPVMRAAGLRAGSAVMAGRLVFPWLDGDGNEVYATGRSINGQEPKYRHSKGKRPPLYASPGAWESRRVALVEGQVDALVCAQGGLSAFATSGASAFSDAAAAILADKDEVVIVADADEAGAKWHAQVVEALAGKVKLLGASLPEGVSDIAEVAERAQGRGDDPGEAVAGVLAESVPVGSAPVEEHDKRKAVALDLDFLNRELEPPRYIVDPYLIAGEVVNLTAMWGAGKTWLAEDLALAVADTERDEWLGMKVAHGPVVYVDEEGSLDITHERLKMLGATPERLRGRLHFYLDAGFRLDNEEWVEELHHIAEDITPTLFIFDSFPRFHGLDENSSGDMAHLYDIGIKPLSRVFGAAVVLLDHPPKDSFGRTKDAAQANRGSGDKMAAVDRGWLLRKRADDAMSLEHMKVRRGTWPPSVLIRRVVEGDRISHLNEGEAGIEAGQVQSDVLALIDYTRKAGGSARRQELVAALGDEKRTTRALSHGKQAGLFVSRQEGRQAVYEVAS